MPKGDLVTLAPLMFDIRLIYRRSIWSDDISSLEDLEQSKGKGGSNKKMRGYFVSTLF